MDPQSEQIIRDIQDKRDRLSENLNELEHKVRSATDWRTYYNRNPWMMVGIALGGGLILSSFFAPHRS